MSIFGSPSATPAPAVPPTPAAPPAPPAFGMVQGQKPGKKSQTPTFLGSADIANLAVPGNSMATAGKTLLGT